MAEAFHYRRRVEFCETDAAGIVHFSAYFQYMEQAEHSRSRHEDCLRQSRDTFG